MVYRALVVESGKEVAVKEIDLDHELADIYEVSREIQILSECRLPNITAYLGCVVNGSKLWVVMEFVDGGLLYDLLHEGPITDERLIADIAKQILLALNYLHNQGKIHRDLKSQNILLTLDGRVKLTDFGVSTQLFSSYSRRNTTVGTPYWMAPEIIVNSSGGHNLQADIWSLGCCVFEMCTGKPPLQDRYSPMQALRIISGFEKDSDFWNAVDSESLAVFLPSLRDFLNQCMVVDPAKRHTAEFLLNHEFMRSEEGSDVHSLLQKFIAARTGQHIKTDLSKFHKTRPLADDHRNTKTIQFDFSTIKEDNRDLSVLTPPSLRQPLDRLDSPSYPYTPKGYSAQKLQLMKSEYQKILDKSLFKLDQRTKLLPYQHSQLASLNDQMLNLFVPVQSLDNAQTKLLVGQHIKNILKELSKKQAEPNGSHLSRSFLPSSLAANSNDKKDSRSLSGNLPMDEVERSLLSSWIESSSRRS